MKRLPYQALLFTALFAVLAAPAAAAAAVKVDFVGPAGFADAGTVPWEQRDNLQTLSRHFETLGQRFLRSGEVLKVDVLDVDLAGWMRPSPSNGGDIRTIRGGADWPSIRLRYSLEVNGKVVRSGSETIADMNYSRGLVDRRSAEPLGYEKKMLERWFRTTFAEQQAAVD